MPRKKLPLFVFSMKNVIGKNLLAEGIMKDTAGNRIMKHKRYDCEKDCNGVRIKLTN